MHVGQLLITWLVIAVGAGGVYADGARRLYDARQEEWVLSSLSRVPCNGLAADAQAQRDCDAARTAHSQRIGEVRQLGRAEQGLTLLLIIAALTTTWLWFDGRKVGKPNEIK